MMPTQRLQIVEPIIASFRPSSQMVRVICLALTANPDSITPLLPCESVLASPAASLPQFQLTLLPILAIEHFAPVQRAIGLRVFVMLRGGGCSVYFHRLFPAHYFHPPSLALAAWPFLRPAMN